MLKKAIGFHSGRYGSFLQKCFAMPDWMTHLGTAYMGARLAGIGEVQLVLVGAVLPDVMMPTFVMIDLLQLEVSLDTFAYLLPFQSLVIVSLLCAAIAVLYSQPGRCFLLVSGGALTHFLLDVMETDIDCGMRIFYPFSFRLWSLGWLATGRVLPSFLLLASAIALGFALRQRATLVQLAFKPNRRNLCCALFVTALVVLIPLTTRQTVVDQNVHSLAFLRDPAAWEERTVDLCFSEVISASPIKIKEFDKQFELVTTDNLRIGERVSLRGLYRDGTIYPNGFHVHRGFSEAWLSLAGLLILCAIWHRGSRPAGPHT